MPAMLPSRDHVLFTVGPKIVDQLPRYSGVYRFYGAEGDLLYIGKSVDIRARVAAHYQEGKQPGRHQRIMQQVIEQLEDVSKVESSPQQTGRRLICTLSPR